MKHLLAPTLISIVLPIFCLSQITYTIDYSFANLSTTACNVFNQPTTYQGYIHQTTVGFPNFTTDNFVINLQCSPNSNDPLGTNPYSTQYCIAFSFKKGFKYNISIYGAAGIIGSQAPLLGVGFSNSITTNSSTNCTGAQLYSVASPAVTTTSSFSSSYAWVNSVVNSTFSQNYSYLLLTALPGNSTEKQSVHIQKIQIV